MLWILLKRLVAPLMKVFILNAIYITELTISPKSIFINFLNFGFWSFRKVNINIVNEYLHGSKLRVSYSICKNIQYYNEWLNVSYLTDHTSIPFWFTPVHRCIVALQGLSHEIDFKNFADVLYYLTMYILVTKFLTF